MKEVIKMTGLKYVLDGETGEPIAVEVTYSGYVEGEGFNTTVLINQIDLDEEKTFDDYLRPQFDTIARQKMVGWLA